MYTPAQFEQLNSFPVVLFYNHVTTLNFVTVMFRGYCFCVWILGPAYDVHICSPERSKFLLWVLLVSGYCSCLIIIKLSLFMWCPVDCAFFVLKVSFNSAFLYKCMWYFHDRDHDKIFVLVYLKKSLYHLYVLVSRFNIVKLEIIFTIFLQ